MKRIIFVVFCLLLSNSCFADSLSNRLQQIELNWEQLNASHDDAQKLSTFPGLLDQVRTLVKAFPDRAEPKILQACIILTRARIQGPFDALSSVNKAHDLLLKAMALNPRASNGSAVVTMGVLYYKVPGWPIAFGDNQKAEQLLTRALKINPQGIDSNYFYGEFLMTQNKPNQAAKYLRKAVNIPVAAGLSSTTLELRTKAKHALRDIQASIVSKNTFFSILTM